MVDFVFKVIVVGQSGVGKTAIVQRYVQKQFQEFDHATIGVDIGMKMLDIEGYSIQVISDTCAHHNTIILTLRICCVF